MRWRRTSSKGDHGTTFGANPLATAAGLATMRYIIENDVPAQGARGSARLVARLRSMEDRLSVVNDVRGRGMLIAVGLTVDSSAEVVAECRERGLLVNNPRPNAVRLMPPFNMSDDEIDRACDILEAAIIAVTSPAPK